MTNYDLFHFRSDNLECCFGFTPNFGKSEIVSNVIVITIIIFIAWLGVLQVSRDCISETSTKNKKNIPKSLYEVPNIVFFPNFEEPIHIIR